MSRVYMDRADCRPNPSRPSLAAGDGAALLKGVYICEVEELQSGFLDTPWHAPPARKSSGL